MGSRDEELTRKRLALSFIFLQSGFRKMNPNTPNKPEIVVRRKLSSGAPEARPPTGIRSWREQSSTDLSASPEEVVGAGASAPDLVPRSRRNKRYSYWRSRDFHVLLALTGTAILAAVIFFTMK